MMLSRRKALLMLAAGAAATRVRAATPAERMLHAADVHVAGYPTVEAVRWIGEQLSLATGGELGISVYHSGQLGREGDTVEMARYGAVDLTRVNFAVLTNPFPLTGVPALPYVFHSVGHMRRAMDGEPGQRILADFARRDLVGLAIYDSGVRSVYNVRRPVHVPQDLKGLKIRVPPSDIFITMARALGANPTPLPFGEVYSALQTHLIDGAENNIRSFHSTRQFEVARYWSETRHSYSPEALLLSRRSLERLPQHQQDLLLRLARESVPVMRAAWDEAERVARAAVLADGVLVNETRIDEFARVTRPVLAAKLADPGLLQLYDSIQALA
jgi:tripartite ATP-independent transporter DctP family solute receptor